MAPQSAQTNATRSRDILLYVMKKTLSVVVGGHVVEVVAVVHVTIGALLDCAKYTRKIEGGLFSNIKKEKKRAKFKSIREKRVTSFLVYRAVHIYYLSYHSSRICAYVST